MSDNVVDSLTGLIPIALVGGLTLGLTQKALNMFPSPGGSKKEGGKEQKWNSLTRKEVVELLGQNKTNLLKKNEGKEYRWGSDTFVYEKGEYYIA